MMKRAILAAAVAAILLVQGGPSPLPGHAEDGDAHDDEYHPDVTTRKIDPYADYLFIEFVLRTGGYIPITGEWLGVRASVVACERPDLILAVDGLAARTLSFQSYRPNVWSAETLVRTPEVPGRYTLDLRPPGGTPLRGTSYVLNVLQGPEMFAGPELIGHPVSGNLRAAFDREEAARGKPSEFDITREQQRKARLMRAQRGPAPAWSPGAEELWDAMERYGIGAPLRADFDGVGERFGRVNEGTAGDAAYRPLQGVIRIGLGFTYRKTGKLNLLGVERDANVLVNVTHETFHAYSHLVVKQHGGVTLSPRVPATLPYLQAARRWLQGQWVRQERSQEAWWPAWERIENFDDFLDEYVAAGIINKLIPAHMDSLARTRRASNPLAPEEAQREFAGYVRRLKTTRIAGYENPGFLGALFGSTPPILETICPPPPWLVDQMVRLLGVGNFAPYAAAPPTPTPPSRPMLQGATHFGGGGGGAIGVLFPRTPTPTATRTPTPTATQPPGGAPATPTPTSPPGTAVFFDGTFRDGDWELVATLTSGSGGTASVRQVTSSGNPGEFRENTHVLNAAPAEAPSNVFSFHRRIGATYDPRTQGGILAIDYSEDARFLSGHDQTTFPALRQGGRIFICTCAAAVSSASSGWVHHDLLNLTSLSFVEIRPGLIQDASQRPDFSPTGTPIDFGYIRGTTHIGPGSTTRVAGIDNWRAAVRAVAAATPTVTPTPTVGLFSDTTFRDADWELAATLTSGSGGTASARQVTSTGNPGEFRENTHVLNAAPAEAPSNVFSFHRRIGATYDPRTQGAILAIDYSEDSRFLSGHDQTTFPALRQGARIYICTCAAAVSSTSAGWVHHDLLNLTSVSFAEIRPGLIQDATQRPDFSATGSPIDFGYMRGTTHIGPVSTTRVAGIDNWRVVVRSNRP